MITAWMQRWGIPPQAVAELQHLLGAATQPANPTATPGSEAAVQNDVRLQHVKLTGGRLWRNNVGVAIGENGQPVRYGLANDSAAINKVVKSSDLIGITPRLCPCGRLYGVFTAYEAKHPGWSFKGTDRETAQLNFGNLVVILGGIFKFVTSERDIQ